MMLTPAMTASSTSAPPVINWKALATHVSPAASLDLFPLPEATTTGLVLRLVRICGACDSAATDGLASAPIPETVMKVLRLIRWFMFSSSPGPGPPVLVAPAAPGNLARDGAMGNSVRRVAALLSWRIRKEKGRLATLPTAPTTDSHSNFSRRRTRHGRPALKRTSACCRDPLRAHPL